MGKVLEDDVKDLAGRHVIAELTGCVKNSKFYFECKVKQSQGCREMTRTWLNFQRISTSAAWWTNYTEARAEAELFLKAGAIIRATDDGDRDQDRNCVGGTWRDAGYILKLGGIGHADQSNVGCEGNRSGRITPKYVPGATAEVERDNQCVNNIISWISSLFKFKTRATSI